MKLMKVLLVDDEELVLEGLSMLIRSQHHDIDIKTVANGKEALDIIGEFDPDIIVTDVRMPIIDGIDLCEKLKEMGHKAKRIIISGYKDFEYARRAIEINAESYILKPISQDKFMKVFDDTIAKLTQENTQKDIERKNRSLAFKKAIQDLVRTGSDELTQLNLKDMEELFSIDRQFCVGVIKINDAEMLHGDIRNELVPDFSSKTINILGKYAADFPEKIAYLEDKCGEFVFIMFLNRSLSENTLQSVCKSIGKELRMSASYAVSNAVSSIKEFNSVYKFCLSSLKKLSGSAEAEGGQIIDRAIDIINRNYFSVTLDSAAKELNISPAYLSKLFKRHLGRNFKDVIVEKRVMVAKILLLNTAMKIFEVSEKVGYSDHKHFFKVFKNEVGKTPVEYRKRNNS